MLAYGTARSNKAMKLTKLSPAPLRGRSAGSCPRRPISDAGTASQLIAGVRPTSGLRADVMRHDVGLRPRGAWQSPS
jgi:hypothetical protein